VSPPDEFIREINAQNVSASLLGEVMVMWASLPRDEWQDFDRRLTHVVDFVAEKRDGESDPMLAMAIALRLMALDAIVVDPEVRGWLMSGKSPDGITYIHGDLVKIAAEQEILEGPVGDPVFDREAFRARLMGIATARGSA
jgi:hypothetical protein